VTVVLRARSGQIELEVRDDGLGISAEHLPQLFRHGFTTKSDGHGFGLHSCANAATEMGGAIRVHSDGPGRGASFVLALPLAQREAA
jgi:signal transduction histidine kinase